MKMKRIATAGVMFALALTPAEKVLADGGSFAAGLIAGVVGSAVVNDINRKNRAKRQHATGGQSGGQSGKSSAPSGQRQANMQVQTALNYFAFPVGPPDGSLGPKSRDAIGQYQAMMGYPATGELTQNEQTFLLNSYYRAEAGGAVTAQAVAANPQGVKGLLIAYRDELAGGGAKAVSTEVAPQGEQGKSPDASVQPDGVLVSDPSVPAQAEAAVQPAAEAAVLPAVQPAAQEAAVQPGATQAAIQPAAVPGGLPSFLGADAVKVSLTAHCDGVAGQTTKNGAMTAVATMTDPAFALSEQFCQARRIAMDDSAALAAKVPGFTPQQVAEQCAGFGPVLKDYVTALGEQPEAKVLERVSGFTLASGMAPTQLAGTARVCLGLGYGADDMNVAIGSALVLSALGETGYAELVGYQLSQGFGVPARPDLATDWYDAALAAPVPAFAGAGADRMAVIRKAVDVISGRAVAEAPAEIVPAKLPTFGAAAAPAAGGVPAPATAPSAGAATAAAPATGAAKTTVSP